MSKKNVTTQGTDLFENAPVPKAVLLNVIPTVISMLMVLVYNLADTFFIGQTKNAVMVAAVSIATPAFLLFMAIGMLFGIGGTSMISRRLGENRGEDAKHASSFCFWTGLGIGVISMVLIWIFVNPVCRIIGADAETFAYAKQYLKIIAVGVPFLIISNMFSNIIRSEGEANTAMIGIVVGNVANIILDPLMILGFGWNVAGAAAATVVGNILSTAVYLYHLIGKSKILSIKLKDYKARQGIALGVLAIGIPASLNSILMSSSNIVVNNFMIKYGNMAVAGLGVAMKVNMIVVMLLIGIGTGIQPLLGYNYGARNRKRFKNILQFAILLTVIVGVVMTIICFVGSSVLVRAFLSNHKAYMFGIQFVHILMMTGPVLGILFVLINTIQAMGAALPSLILSVSRQGIIYLPVLCILNTACSSAKMLVFAQPIGDVASILLAFLLFLYSYKKTDWERNV